ncbi:hypothetical protein [Rice orange leaf phytoplasma]|uniref:hypothetical protein n=1 Tax=Rice orange leaf phytoplasma TaxID=146897 RepID=UPI0008F562BA|nr:hypothetical protein [Rice orange leaf phytoplasma]OIJ45010.1 hypothetical protein BHE82_00420 [Rice orange leaf phytoplasma]
MKVLDPKYFVLINQTLLDKNITSENKIVGYYRNTFKKLWKNKSTKSALFMILVVLFFTAVGPFINLLPKTTQEKEKSWIALLPPKIPFLEKFGICDGTKKVDLYLDEIEQIKKFNPNIIKKQQAIKDNKQTVILDAYLYCEYKKSSINLTFTQKEYDLDKQNKSLI